MASGRVHSRTFVWHFDCPPDAVWPVLADTARFNEAAKLPKHDIEETAQADGSVEYLGRARKGPFVLVWQERPVNWVTNQWFQHCREFRRGPLASLCATFRLFQDGPGSRGEYRIDVAPRNLVGRLIIGAGFFRNAARNLGRLAKDAERFALKQTEQPFAYQPPTPGPGIAERVKRLVAQIEASGHGHGLAQGLADYVLTVQEVDLVHIRPLALARAWEVPPRHAIELCLEAARAGLLVLRWDLLCPRCRIPKATVPGLDELPDGAHCDTCNIDYDGDFSRNVELSFSPAPAVRSIEAGEYCLFGPMSTPHIHIHLTLAPGERREVEAELPAGHYRLRTLEAGPECEATVEADGFPEVILTGDSVSAGAPGRPGHVTLDNRSNRPLTAIVEERAWIRDALTADRVTSLQAFRDLFSDQVLRPGDEVAVGRITLMFTDLRGSTALYTEVGDASAYHMVREHFAYLTDIVRNHDGAIVKTLGDAIMAAFIKPADGLAAALEVQRRLPLFNAELQDRPIVIKLGLHEGPTIAVNLNGRLDYFGSTVNMAARLQAQSEGGDIVLSEAIAADPDVRELLAEESLAEEAAPLKGFEEPVPYFRLSPRLE